MSRKNANGEGSIFPYRNGYAAYVWVDTPDGLRKRKWVYGKDRETVHKKWLRLHAASARGPVPTSTPTLGQYIEYWLTEIVEPTKAPLSYATWETLCRVHIVPAIGGKRLDRLPNQVRGLQKWINSLQRICQCCAQEKDLKRREGLQRCCAIGKCCNWILAPRTIKDIRDVLRNVLAHAVKAGLVSINVATYLTLPPARRKKGKRWTNAEAQRFLTSALNDNDPLYAAYVLIVVLGFRKGEVLGQQWSCIDFNVEEICVEWQLQRVKGELLLRETKTETSDATLPMPVIAIVALDVRKMQQEAAREQAGKTWYTSDLVFTSEFGKAVDPRNFDRAWYARCAKAGVPRITPHDGRRSCGSLLADLDVHPRVAMRILRHAQFSVTMEIYTQISDEKTREALKRLGESLEG